MARRAAAVCSLGAAAALAMPPYHLLPLLVPAFVGLLWLIEGSRTIRGAAAIGWWFGLGHFAVGLYWIAYSFMIDAERLAWLAAPAMLALAAGLAVFSALACILAKAIGGRGLGRVLGLAAAWTIAEWLRGHVLTGFPWNLVGYAWAVSPAPLQLASMVGIYGLTFVTVMLAAMPALLDRSHMRTVVGRWWPAAGLALGVLALWTSGAVRLAGADTATVPGVRLRLVQAGIEQSLKWRPEETAAIFARHVELSRAPSSAPPPTHIIWPETATPFFIAETAEALDTVASLVMPGGAAIVGSPRRSRDENGETRIWNSVLAISSTGNITGTYDKVRLVPFGEFVPFRSLLPMEKLTAGSIDFTPGDGARTLSVTGLPPFRPLICYEAIFPETRTANPRPAQWLLNVTNDAWFGESAGPYQHFAMARVRAVEQGVPLVRAANTGISAVIDAYGRATASLGLGHTGVVDAPLPRPAPEPTPYARFGDVGAAFMMFLGLAYGLATRGAACDPGKRTTAAASQTLASRGKVKCRQPMRHPDPYDDS